VSNEKAVGAYPTVKASKKVSASRSNIDMTQKSTH
jgi:hypothetical protein